MKGAILGSVTALAVTVTCIAAAQQPRPEDVHKFRQSSMQIQRMQMGQLAPMVKGARPFDKDLALRDAMLLELLAKQQPDIFLPDTAVANSRSKPEIWKEPEKFKAASMSFQNEAGKLVEAARSGNVDAFKGAFGAVAKSCDTCHDNYRSK